MLDMMDSGVSAIPFTDRIAHAAVERREAVMRVYVGSWPDAESPGTRETSRGATRHYEGTRSIDGSGGCDIVEAAAAAG
jgi:hypothetical protein